jgi:hypothetical protein
MPDDLNFQKLSTVQSGNMPDGPGVRTIASAATIVPTTFLTIITGTTQLVNITPPVTGVHVLAFLFPDAMGAFSTAGNILTGVDPGVNIVVFMVYNPLTGKYAPGPIS